LIRSDHRDLLSATKFAPLNCLLSVYYLLTFHTRITTRRRVWRYQRGNQKDKIAVKRLEWQLENLAAKRHSICSPCMKDAESFRTLGDQDGMYITENLTKYRTELVKKLSQLKYSKQIYTYWTSDGRIYVKQTETSRKQTVNNFDDIMNFDRSNQQHTSFQSSDIEEP